MNRVRILTVLGTRPEAIKLGPVIRELTKAECFDSRVCVTAQHREMLDPMLSLFSIRPDYDLNVMRPRQALGDLTKRLLASLTTILAKERPALVIVQGDTTTALAAALAAFYEKIDVAHIEAGLRTRDKWSPFPEEMNRRLITCLADLHFAPTERARRNLLREGVSPDRVFVTGNTVVDALEAILKHGGGRDIPRELGLDPDRKLVVVTAHRRENLGAPLVNICHAIRGIVAQRRDVEVVYPLHLNPNVRSTVLPILGGLDRIHIVEPLDYVSFVLLMSRADVILTDSGGIQEEAPSLGVPVLVLRNATERPEAVEAGLAKVVGTSPTDIVNETMRILNSCQVRRSINGRSNPFGDGKASSRIVDVLVKELCGDDVASVGDPVERT